MDWPGRRTEVRPSAYTSIQGCWSGKVRTTRKKKQRAQNKSRGSQPACKQANRVWVQKHKNERLHAAQKGKKQEAATIWQAQSTNKNNKENHRYFFVTHWQLTTVWTNVVECGCEKIPLFPSRRIPSFRVRTLLWPELMMAKTRPQKRGVEYNKRGAGGKAVYLPFECPCRFYVSKRETPKLILIRKRGLCWNKVEENLQRARACAWPIMCITETPIAREDADGTWAIYMVVEWWHMKVENFGFVDGRLFRVNKICRIVFFLISFFSSKSFLDFTLRFIFRFV